MVTEPDAADVLARPKVMVTVLATAVTVLGVTPVGNVSAVARALWPELEAGQNA
jgi:hypothetical protein